MTDTQTVPITEELPFNPEMPQERIKDETSLAYKYFMQYLEMYPRDHYKIANDTENLREQHGDKDDQGNLVYPQAPESETAARAIREQNYQSFFTNELDMLLDVQKMVKEALKKCETITDLEQQSQIVWKFMKTHMDVRAILKEMFGDHVDAERKRTAEEQSRINEQQQQRQTPSLTDEEATTHNV